MGDTPALPAGYTLDQASPPLPPGYALDSAPLKAPPGNTFQTITPEQWNVLTPEDKQRIVSEHTDNEARSLTRAGQMVLGGGGIQNVGEQAMDASSAIRTFLNHPKVKPIVDMLEKEANKIPGVEPVSMAAKAGWGFLKPMLDKLTSGGGGGLDEVTPQPVRESPPLPEAFQPRATPPPGSVGNPFRSDPRLPAPPPEVTPQPVSTPAPPAVPVTKKAVSSAVDDALNVEPFQAKPGVPIRSQIVPRSANPTAGIPAGHTAVDSSALSSFKYDPEASELHVVTNSNPKTVYVYGDVSADQAKAFTDADSKGKAWSELKQQGSPLVAKIENGTRIPVRPTPAPAPVITLPAGTNETDLSPQLQESLRRIRAARAAKQVQ